MGIYWYESFALEGWLLLSHRRYVTYETAVRGDCCFFLHHPTSRQKWRKRNTHTRYSVIFAPQHKNTRTRVSKGIRLVKIAKKSCQKLLTKTKVSDNICKHSSRATLRKAKKVDTKKVEKTFKKVLTKGVWCDILFELSRKKGIAIGPWKLNNEIRKGTRDSMVTNHQEEFLKVLFKQ